jgi:hypothetical protein
MRVIAVALLLLLQGLMRHRHRSPSCPVGYLQTVP